MCLFNRHVSLAKRISHSHVWAQIHTRTTHGSHARRVGRVSAASGESVLDVLYALGLVGVGEPVLAHVEVVAEADWRSVSTCV